jgi:hypothetical protein
MDRSKVDFTLAAELMDEVLAMWKRRFEAARVTLLNDFVKEFLQAS